MATTTSRTEPTWPVSNNTGRDFMPGTSPEGREPAPPAAVGRRDRDGKVAAAKHPEGPGGLRRMEQGRSFRLPTR
jgi:hypothetical protein